MSVVTRIRTSHEVTLPFTPDEVWSVLADVAAYPDWWPAIRGVEVIRYQGGPLGAEFEVRPFMGRTFRIRFEELEGQTSLRLRFFGGSLEGPGGFHLRAVEGATRVRYEMDVFIRGMEIAVLSQLLPYEWIHRSRMRSVLRRLKARLRKMSRTAKPVALPEAVVPELADSATSPSSESNFDGARRYLEVLSSRAPAEEIATFLAPGVIQEEYPHRFLDATLTRGRSAILEARTCALARFSAERFELTAVTGGGEQVALEIRWKGMVASTGDGYQEGQELDARVALFLKFSEGRIVRERSYACFEPWSSAAERKAALDERLALAGPSGRGLPTAEAGPPPSGSNFDIARAYLEELGARASAETIARFFAPDVVQDEFPNRFLPAGAHRDLEALKLARSRSLAFLASENYELVSATGDGSMVALEVHWTGVVAEAMGPFTVGQGLEARVAIFLKFHEGRIVAQRNYACA